LEELHQGHYTAPPPSSPVVDEPAETKTARKTIKSVKMCPSAESECKARLLGAKDKNNRDGNTCGVSSLFETVLILSLLVIISILNLLII
jgi:hypothetical protein